MHSHGTARVRHLRIALVGNCDFSMLQFRGDLIRHLIGLRHSVHLLLPPGKYSEQLRMMGATIVTIPISRYPTLWGDLLLLYRLFWLFLKHDFDVVQLMTAKPNVIGGIAARLAKSRHVVGLVSGAGQLFAHSRNTSIFTRLTYTLGRKVYKFAMRGMDFVWFQNPDDADSFVQTGYVQREKAVVILGSGVDTDRYCPTSVSQLQREAARKQWGITPNSILVVMVARLIWAKGVKEFLEAARILTERQPNTHFLMIAPEEPADPDAVPLSYLDQFVQPNLTMHFRSWRDDTHLILSTADIVVLDSYYREGVPRTLLEAMALGKPLITSDWPGCRETVQDGINGFLIPPRNAPALAEKIAMLASDPLLRNKMGVKSRKLAIERFSSRGHVRRIVKLLYNRHHHSPVEPRSIGTAFITPCNPSSFANPR